MFFFVNQILFDSQSFEFLIVQLLIKVMLLKLFIKIYVNLRLRIGNIFTSDFFYEADNIKNENL